MQESCTDLYDRLVTDMPIEASYAVTLAHRIRFTMTMNAREAMHLIELRSQPQGHESYRWVAREMHRLIAGRGGASGDRGDDDLRGRERPGGRAASRRGAAPGGAAGAARVRAAPRPCGRTALRPAVQARRCVEIEAEAVAPDGRP